MPRTADRAATLLDDDLLADSFCPERPTGDHSAMAKFVEFGR